METATQKLHRLTSYEPGREWTEVPDDPALVQDLEVNDISTLPWFFKRYPGDLPRTELPRDLPATTLPALAILAGAEPPPGDLDLAQLSRILYLSAGVVRTGRRSWGTVPFRAAGSAGARFPLEVYVAVPEGGLLPAGIHWYDAQAHALVRIGPAPREGSPAIVVTGIPWRTGWRYRERGYRHIYWDLGTMLSQLLATASSAGVRPSLYSRFPDETVTALVGADGVNEFPVAVVALGGPLPALSPDGESAAGQVSAEVREFPLVTAAQKAGAGEALGQPWDDGPVVDAPADVTAPVEAVVLQRGSQRIMDPARSLPGELLRTAMAIAMRGIDLPNYVVVHAVDGLVPGLYRWPDLEKPLRTGNLREELYRVCLEQELGRDAAFVVVTAADVAALDDPGYREAQLAGGLVEGRLHLAAYALGAGATGMTFQDSDIAGLLGEPLDAMIFTCVGVPSYKSAKGGLPGNPTPVRNMLS